MEPASTLHHVKIASTTHDVHPLIRQRWSARAFEQTALTEAELLTLFEAASWTASSMNEQPWHFVYAHKGEPAHQHFVDCLMVGNQLWAKDAPVLVLALARTAHAKDGSPNRFALHDVGAATTSLLIQAAAMGILGHIMGGYDLAKTKEVFDIQAPFEPVTFVALGRPGDAEQLQEPFRTRETTPRSRKDLSTIFSKLKR